MSRPVTPATQNDIRTCLEALEKERFCSFPHGRRRHGDATKKTERRDETCWKPQNKHFVRGSLKFSHFVATSTFSYEFSHEPQHLLHQNRYFMRGFPQFSSHALTMRFAENTQHDTPEVLRLPRDMTMEVSKVQRRP